MFINEADLQAAIEATLQKEDGGLDLSIWSKKLEAANRFAYWEIVSRLAARGYSRAQIDSWDRGEEFQEDLAVFHALNKQSGISQSNSYSIENLEKLDRRPELSGDPAKGIPGVFVTIDGEFVTPLNQFGAVVTGAMDTGGDEFVPLDPCDTRAGNPMVL